MVLKTMKGGLLTLSVFRYLKFLFYPRTASNI